MEFFYSKGAFRKSFIEILPNCRDNHQREIISLLEKTDINEEDEGKLFDNCITIWKKTKIQPSVRFHAFKMILKIAEKYPELQSEFDFLTEPRFMDSLTHGVRHSVNILLKKFKSRKQYEN